MTAPSAGSPHRLRQFGRVVLAWVSAGMCTVIGAVAFFGVAFGCADGCSAGGRTIQIGAWVVVVVATVVAASTGYAAARSSLRRWAFWLVAVVVAAVALVSIGSAL